MMASSSSARSLRLLLLLLLWCLVADVVLVGASSEVSHWWKDPQMKWIRVPQDYNWKKRRTGVRPQWASHLGHWKHYKAPQLANSQTDTIRNPRPWTKGRMSKFLRQASSNDRSFELLSVYEESAKLTGARDGSNNVNVPSTICGRWATCSRKRPIASLHCPANFPKK